MNKSQTTLHQHIAGNNTSQPMVSVIMALYNQDAYVAEAIKSVLAQDYGNFELLVINDGSTDGSLRIAERYAEKDKRIKVISTPNGGSSVARNHGLDAMSGQIVMFIDSDDALASGIITECVKLLESSNADAVFYAFSKVKDLPSSFASGKPQKNVSMKIMDSTEATERSLYQRPLFNSAWQIAARIEVFKSEPPLRFAPGVYYEDLEIHHRLLKRCRKVILTSRIGYFYRQQSASTMHTFNAKRLDMLKVTEGIEQAMTANPTRLRRAASDRRFSANFNFLLLAARHDRNKEYLTEADNCWQLIKARRFSEIINPKVRIKNKIGALLSYLGRPITEAIGSRLIK